jgi:membrane protein
MDLLDFKKSPVWKLTVRFWSAFRYYVVGLYNRVGEHHVFLLSGGLAFSLFICIVPLILIVFAGLGMILEKPSIMNEIELFIDAAIPYHDFAASVKDIVIHRINEFRLYKNLAGLIGVAGLIFASSGLFSSMRTTLNVVYRVSSTESVIVGKLRDIGLVLLVLVYFLLSTTILPIIRIIEDFAERNEVLASLNLSFLGELTLSIISLLIIFISFFIVYFFIPHSKPPKKVIIVSAAVAALLWLIAERIFGFYITNIVTLKKIYGAYFFMIVVAFWIYYTSLVFIMGAEIGQLYGERSGNNSHSG